MQSDEWAQIKKKKKKEGEDTDSDEDGDAILYRSQPLTVPDSRLLPSIIKVGTRPNVHKHQVRKMGQGKNKER